MACEHDKGPLSGMYFIHCPDCRVRLVRSARPSRAMQERMLDYIRIKCGQSIADQTINDLKGVAP